MNHTIGISKIACTFFGITPKYIMRNKGFTTAPYSMSKLSEEIVKEENLHRLEIGMELIINPESILEYLDYDYLKREEEIAVRRAVVNSRKVFTMMINFNFKDLVKIKVFVMVDLGIVNDSSKMGSQPSMEEEDTNQLIQENMTNIRGESIASSQASSIGTRSTGSESLKNLKKQANIRERPSSVNFLICYIVFFVITMVGLSLAEYILFVKYKIKITTLS